LTCVVVLKTLWHYRASVWWCSLHVFDHVWQVLRLFVWVSGRTKRINAFLMAGSWDRGQARESGWDNDSGGIRLVDHFESLWGSTWNP